MKSFDGWLNRLKSKPIYVDLLQYFLDASKNQPRVTSYVGVRRHFEGKLNADEYNTVMQDLFNAGYLVNIRSRYITPYIAMTEKGKLFLFNYHDFKMKGILAKFTIIFQENAIAIISTLALVVSVISLLK